MSQIGFFDADKRLSMLSAKGDPLVSISALVPWEKFRGDIEAVVLTADEARKSSAGRKPIDALVLFRMLVLQSLYNPGLVTKPLGPMSRSSTRCATVCRSHAFSGWASRTAFQMARPFGRLRAGSCLFLRFGYFAPSP